MTEREIEKLKRMHENFVVVSGGRVLKNGARHDFAKSKKVKVGNKKESKAIGKLEEIRKKFPKAYMPWTKEEDEKLCEFFQKNIPIKDIAKEFERKRGAITARLEKLGLIEN